MISDISWYLHWAHAVPVNQKYIWIMIKFWKPFYSSNSRHGKIFQSDSKRFDGVIICESFLNWVTFYRIILALWVIRLSINMKYIIYFKYYFYKYTSIQLQPQSITVKVAHTNWCSRPVECTCRLNWTNKDWRSEVEHTPSRSKKHPAILILAPLSSGYRGFRRIRSFFILIFFIFILTVYDWGW